MEPCIQFIPIQVLSYKILQVHYPVVPYFKLQYIVFVVQHGQMDVFLNTFLIGIIRQLLISPIPRDDGILARNHCKVDNAAVITQHFKGITRFQYPGNIRDFGPLYLPKTGDKVEMNRENYLLYRKLIAWEQKAEINYNDSTVFLNGEPIREYRFLKNYYFMAGDKGENSQDSRYWGLLPEEYIVGKAAFIWKSVDPYTCLLYTSDAADEL